MAYRNDRHLASSWKTRFKFGIILLSFILIINNSQIIHSIVAVLITNIFKYLCLNILPISSLINLCVSVRIAAASSLSKSLPNSHPKRIKVVDLSVWARQFATFHNMTYRWDRSTCWNRLIIVCDRAMTLDVFFFVRRVKRPWRYIAANHIEQCRRVLLPPTCVHAWYFLHLVH